MTKRRVCVVTGSRAEYGLLHWLMREIQSDPRLELQVAVTGMHLSPDFGHTVREIEQDGMPICCRVDMLSAGDDKASMARSVGHGVVGFSDAFEHSRPDIVVVLGDRFETLAASQAAALLGIPLAHLCGGEVTVGAVDDWIRHAISKMAWWHFPQAEPYRRRLMQLGESPERIFTVGAPGLESIHRLPVLGRKELAADLGIPLAAPLLLVTYHPATLGTTAPDAAFAELLAALEGFPEATVILTKPNADSGGRRLGSMAEEWAAERAGPTRCVTSLGQTRYLSLMRLADVVVGNSSSGIIEAPAVGVATLNIGPRQQGRLMADSIICCDEDRQAIAAGLSRALDAEFRAGLPRVLPYYRGDNVAARIRDVLAESPLPQTLAKDFNDL